MNYAFEHCNFFYIEQIHNYIGRKFIGRIYCSPWDEYHHYRNSNFLLTWGSKFVHSGQLTTGWQVLSHCSCKQTRNLIPIPVWSPLKLPGSSAFRSADNQRFQYLLICLASSPGVLLIVSAVVSFCAHPSSALLSLASMSESKQDTKITEAHQIMWVGKRARLYVIILA